MLEERLPDLIERFAVIQDPRAQNVSHKVTDILVIAICAVICGANSFTEIEQYGQGKESWLSEFLELKHGIPSHDTFRRVFMILDASIWQSIFTDWAEGLRVGKVESPTEVLAVDGKWSRASGLHTVSVWAAEHHIVLAQEQVADKTNEITVIPNLLETLDIADTTITIDAAGTQKQIAWTIREHHGNYVLALKANHKQLFEDVKWLFEQHQAEADWSTQTKGHGRLETRELWLIEDLDFLGTKVAWRDLKAVVKVKSTRLIKGETSTANRYFLTSLNDPETLAYAIRKHWAIENNLHWTLDIAFDDANAAKAENAQANLITLRHLSLNQLKRESSLKASIKAKRKRAGWDNDYLLKVLYA